MYKWQDPNHRSYSACQRFDEVRHQRVLHIFFKTSLWYWRNFTTVPAQQLERVWVHTSDVFTKNYKASIENIGTTKPRAYCMGYTIHHVSVNVLWYYTFQWHSDHSIQTFHDFVLLNSNHMSTTVLPTSRPSVQYYSLELNLDTYEKLLKKTIRLTKAKDYVE